MDACCSPAALATRQQRVLWLVLAINSAMFLAETTAGLLAHSTALLADALDMLGDALVYGLSLYALRRGETWRAGAALGKGLIMAAFGLGVVGEAVSKALHGTVPRAPLMGVFGVLALAANLACFALLLRHRGDDLNLRSAWLCSRNDVLANAGVLLAAAGVALSGTLWPDLVIGLLIATLFLASAGGVIRAAATALRQAARP
ncbi:MAG: hypothetical protein KatS3mg131_3929 [Candidatus Tectimicrobiota bacterium]|nr:MAG: hypothetical protein KatS3mg131_3929 [Candidatus Tectomicrobia bacterium]